MKIKVIASSGQVGYFDNDVFVFNNIPNTRAGIYSENQHRGEYFRYDTDNPFYVLQWNFNEIDISLITGYTSDIIVIPVSSLIVIQSFDIKINRDGKIQHILRKDKQRWVTVVINPDGTINHQIKPPKYIYHHNTAPSDTFLPKNKLEEMTAFNKLPVEGIGSICFDKQRNSLSIHLNFHYDWYQERLYNAETQEWGEIISTGRY